MTDEEKLMRMFTAVHGEITGACYTEIEYAQPFEVEPIAINVMKHGNLCWTKSKSDILFDYITKDWS